MFFTTAGNDNVKYLTKTFLFCLKADKLWFCIFLIMPLLFYCLLIKREKPDKLMVLRFYYACAFSYCKMYYVIISIELLGKNWCIL